MADNIRLKVPLIGQAREMDCWYAAVNMVCLYHVVGPRNGVPSAWKANKGLPFENFATLAQGEHLIPVTFPDGYEWSDSAMVKILKAWGPIWAWGEWFGESHIITLTGVNNGQVLANNPDGPKECTFTLGDFNKKLVRNYPANAPPLMVYKYPNKEKLAADSA